MHCFPDMLRNKFFAAVAVGGTRNGGQEAAVMDIINLFGTRTMNLGAEGAAEDQIGMKTVVDLAAKLAEVCLTYRLGKEALAAEKT